MRHTRKEAIFSFTALLTVVLFISPFFASAQNSDGCLLWLDAMELDGIANGGSVADWQGKAGGHMAHQSDPAQQPVYEDANVTGYPAVRFQGSECLVSGFTADWSAMDWTVFAVATLDVDAPDGYRGILGNRFGAGKANWWTLGTKNDGSAYLELAAGKGINPNRRLADSNSHLYTVLKRGSTFSLFQDGELLGSAERDNVGGVKNELRIGRWFAADQGWIGRIAEVRVYNHAMNDKERVAFEKELLAKWEIVPPPDIYRKQATWAETMIDARDRLLGLASGESSRSRRDWRAYVWERIRADFPREAQAIERASEGNRHLAWFLDRDSNELERTLVGKAGEIIDRKVEALRAGGVPPGDVRWLELMLEADTVRSRFAQARAHLERLDLNALRRAIQDLQRTFPEDYPYGAPYLAELDRYTHERGGILSALDAYDLAALEKAESVLTFYREALLANPLLDFDRLLFVRRGLSSPALGLPQNWQSNCVLPRKGFDDEIAVLSPPSPDGQSSTFYRPAEPVFVGDIDLHFDADRLLFSSIGSKNCWQIFEMAIDGSGFRQVTPGDQPDVDSYDACYLPDGDIIFCSNAYYAAVPCVNGSTRTAVLYRMHPDGTGIRQLCFDQEHSWCPTVLNNGRVMYLRWEYTDTPHTHDRVLFHMNPDGTEQMEYYGSNSYWPNSLFYAQPVPGHPTQFVGIVGGHHGVRRMGELVLFDPARGRREAAGAIQRIPGYGKPVTSETDPKYRSTLIQDRLVDDSWPKFLHPYPLSGKYFLVACQPTRDSLWGIYLVDVFDNMLLLREEPGYALFEPIPVRKRRKPPLVPPKVDLNRDDALIYLADVYEGEGLDGIPRGAVKSLRLFTYHFVYPGMGGPQAVVGMEGPWDIKRIMGTVPVAEDGSAYFRVPANTPISLQPLDEEGKALQLMRSWFTAMPGEVLSCAGCHESQNMGPPAKQALAMQRPPAEIEPWYGPSRGFNFLRELQPDLDKYCIGCHDGSKNDLPNLKERSYITDYTSVFHHGKKDAG
ncbi:MAG: LamG-like jellyroll fold domain-containing protein, partial [Candidatus Hydrogenedentota bacterium]